MIRNILVTLDGSKLAETALWEIPMFAQPGTKIHVLSVVTQDFVQGLANVGNTLSQALAVSSSTVLPHDFLIDPQEVAEREAYLHQASDWLVDEGYEVKVEALPGNALETILNAACENTDLIVMATHGRTGLKRLALGSVTEAVLHKAPCPVLIVPAQEHNRVRTVPKN